MLPWQWHIRQLNYQKTKFALLTCLLPVLATKGSSVLEKNVNETQVSKTVFGHLKEVVNFLTEHQEIPDNISFLEITSISPFEKSICVK